MVFPPCANRFTVPHCRSQGHMSRTFNGSTDYLRYNTGAILSVHPVTLACWFKTTDTTNNQTLMALSASAATASLQEIHLGAAGGTAGDPVRAYVADGSAAGQAVSSTGYSSGVWHHACGVFTAVNSRAAFIDGGSKGTDANSRTPAGIDQATMGARVQATTISLLTGNIAEAGIWDVALTDDEVASLAKGFSPLLIRPTSLVAYWPLIGKYSPEIDVVGGFGMTITSATVGDHSPLLRNFENAGVGIPTTLGQATKSMHQFRMRRVA